MKILQVITSMNIGGAEKLITEITPLLRDKGHQVDVLLFDGTETAFKQNLLDNGICVYEFGKGGSVYNPLYIFRLLPFLKKYDIVHTHNTAPQLFAAIGSVLCSVVLVTTEHTTANRRRGWRWYWLIDRWMYNRYQSVICISDAAENNLKKYLDHYHTNITTIYNGVNFQSFIDAKAETALKKQTVGKAVVVMVAGFRYQKDQDTLIKAFGYLPKDKYELWLVGDGERRQILEQLVDEKNLKDNVRFLGVRNDIPQILKAADIVVMSSHFEGLSLSSIEGMAVEKPFLASDVDGLREITMGAGILFPHGDVRQLAKEIEQLMDDREYYKTVADKCMKRAKKYDIFKMVDEYEKEYKVLINEYV
ncbi:glycosyltransferase [Bacteroides faecium]|uniref:Glycosyltransferase n=1 Tax=Bacteroides faecium TaxID=2715212 RepID=A0A6H0KP41_9BACE|nr:glycosyltransferase [Bacteroides faecium]QIU95150.1 glycosyltransferase [Bacteroides faecium]